VVTAGKGAFSELSIPLKPWVISRIMPAMVVRTIATAAVFLRVIVIFPFFEQNAKVTLLTLIGNNVLS